MHQRNGANIHLISNPQKRIDMITLTHKSNLSLPMSVRTYIDGCAYEYTEIDAWTKLAHIAYLVKRGANLLPEFIEDIERHMENPAPTKFPLIPNLLVTELQRLCLRK